MGTPISGEGTLVKLGHSLTRVQI